MCGIMQLTCHSILGERGRKGLEEERDRERQKERQGETGRERGRERGKERDRKREGEKGRGRHFNSHYDPLVMALSC